MSKTAFHPSSRHSSLHSEKSLVRRWASALGAVTLMAFFAGARPETAEAQSTGQPFKSTWNVGLPGSKGHEPKRPVGACIADFIDTSESVTNERLQRELESFAQALESEEFGAALEQIRHQSIAMHIAFFNSNIRPITQGWYVVDRKSRFDLAHIIREAKRNGQGYTRHDQAVQYGLQQLESCQSQNPVIDIVTDGKQNFIGCTFPSAYNCAAGIPIAEAARDEATARGVAINVLAVEIDKSPALAEWVRDHLATRPYDLQVPLMKGVKAPAVPGKIFHIFGAELLGNAQSGGDKFKEYRIRKLIEEIAAPLPRALRHG